MTNNERAEMEAAYVAWDLSDPTSDVCGERTAYCKGWADGRGVVASPGFVRLIPPGTTHMQYGVQRRMAIADYLQSPHYSEPGWTPAKRVVEHDQPGTMTYRPLGYGITWQHWTREGWK